MSTQSKMIELMIEEKKGYRAYILQAAEEVALLKALRETKEFEFQWLTLEDVQESNSRMSIFTPTDVQGDDGIIAILKEKAKSVVSKITGVDTMISELADSTLNIIVNVMETLPIVLYHLKHASTMMDIIMCLVGALKMLSSVNLTSCFMETSKLITSWIKEIWSVPPESTELQFGFDEVQQIVIASRSLLKKFEEFKTSKFVEKLHKLLRYFLSFGMFQVFGLSFDNLKYSEYEKQNVLKNYSSREEFFFSLFDSVTWFLERGMQAYKTGSWSPFFHSSQEYTKWVDEAYRIREDEKKLCNAAAVDLDESMFFGRLAKLIEQGDAMIKYVEDKQEKTFVKSMMSELRLIKARRLTESAAQQSRKAPFATLVYGDSCVGKSKFTEVLFKYFGALKGLDTDESYKYVRCFADKFYSGFKTHMWCIQIDDIALQSPGLGVMDPSSVDVIQIINGVANCPPQADLADKGKTPMRPKLVLGTTNTIDLNAHAYFSYPLAIRRRFKYVVDLKIKPKYAEMSADGATPMLDPSLLPEIDDGDFPNQWLIDLYVVNALPGTNGKSTVKLVPLFEKPCEDIHEFLTFWGHLIQAFDANQEKDIATTTAMSKARVCHRCCCPLKGDKCRCEEGPELQAGESPAPPALVRDIATIEWERELHDNHPAEWILYTMRRLRSHTPVPKYDVEEAARLQGGSMREILSRSTDPVLTDEDVAERLLNDDTWFISTKLSTWESIVWFAEDVWDTSAAFLLYSTAMLKEKVMSVCDQITWAKNASFEIADAMARCAAAKVSIAWNKCTEPLVAYSLMRLVLYSKKFATQVFSEMGAKVADRLKDVRIQAFIGLIAVAIPSFFAIQYLFRSDVQGQVPSNIPKSEQTNMWEQKDPFRLSALDLGSRTLGSKSQTFDETLKRILANCVYIKCSTDNEPGKFGRAVCLRGHCYMAPSHIIPEGCTSLTVRDSDSGTFQLSSSITMKTDETSFFRIPEKDLVFFLCYLPPKASIIEFFPKRSIAGAIFEGALVSREEDGTVRTTCAQKIQHKMMHVPAPVDRDISSWGFTPSEATRKGDCGALLIADNDLGVILLGLHQTWNHFTGATAIEILLQDIERGMSQFPVQVQGSMPDLADKELHELHWKSVFHEMKGNMKVYGSFGKQNFRAGPKTRVCDTYISEAAQAEGFVKRTFAPIMKGPEPWRIAAEPSAAISGMLKLSDVDTAVEGYVNDVLSRLEPHFLHELHPLNDEEAVNGMPGVRFIDKMNRNTSMGFPYKKSKRNFLVEMDDKSRFQDGVMFTSEIQDEIKRIEALYEQGKTAAPVFVGCLKDEPLPEKKIKSKKTRVFLNGPAAWSVVVRKYLLPFVRVFQENPLIFEGAPGINCNSNQWTELKEYLSAFGDNNVAGDYATFDKKMEAQIILKAFYAIECILVAAGCSDKHIMAVRCIAEDTAYAFIDFQGDLIQFFGSNPSGHPLTVIINCIVNSLYMRYCYLKLNPAKECSSFQLFVHLITYGDDNAMNVSPRIPWFNHTTIQKCLAEHGITYTMADKDAASVPYIPFSQVSFLKRTWRWDNEAQIWCCPLDWSSIEKMLTKTTRSDSICLKQQSAEAIASAAAEMWQYGRDVFEVNVAKLQRIIAVTKLEAYIEPNTIRTWEEYRELHDRCSIGFAKIDPINKK